MLSIKNRLIKTMAGPDIPNGSILIDDAGKIAAVGTDLTPPDGAEVLDAGGRLVTPGCVEAHSHIGLHEEAWQVITINPAQIMGIADRVGSLEPGKDADVVIWTADPLTVVGGKAYTTIVDGKVVWQLP